MQKRGEITAFLSMVLLCVVSLMCGLIESARLAGAHYYLKLAADSAMDSVFSGYHRGVWEDYKLFFLEYEDAAELEDLWLGFAKPYEETHGWYPFQLESAEAEELVGVAEHGGEHVKQEILDYMQYGIWDIDTDELHAADLLRNIKEASAAGEISNAYGEHTKEAVRLEKALEAVAGNLKEQQELWDDAMSCLQDWDGSGFRKQAKNLEKTIGKLPGLVKTYGKRADALRESLEETRREMSVRTAELSPEIRAAMEEEIASYASYVEQDGERRQEITGLYEAEAGNRDLISRAVDRSREVEKMIDDWESSHEEDDDEPDRSGLWASVEGIWAQIRIPVLSCAFGVKDKEKEGLLEQIAKMADFDLLTLVMPEGKEVSRAVLDTADFLAPPENGTDAGLIERLLTGEYMDRFLTDFLSEEKKQVQYEEEYVINGKNSDEENLKETVKSLLTIREGMNLIHILSDAEKRQEAKALAAAVTGAVGLAPLTGVVAFFVMTVWALGEALMDVKTLLEGKHVPLMKTRATWKLKLEQLLDIGKQGKLGGGGEDQDGLDYEGYLKILLFLGEPGTIYYRLLNVIQMNTRRKQPDFSISHCAWKLKLRGKAKGKHLFFSGGGRYSMEVVTDKAY